MSARPRWLLPAGALLAAILLAHAAHALAGQPDASGTFSAWSYNLLLAGAAAGCLARARLVAGHRRQWGLIGAGLASWSAGELWIEFGNGSAPGLTDAAFLTFYVLALAGLWSLYTTDRASRAGWFWIDAVTGVLTVTAVWAASAGGPILTVAASESTFERTLDVAYPLLDLLLLLVVVVGLAGHGWRAGRASTLLASGLLLIAFADMVFAWQVSGGNYTGGALLDSVWPLGALLIAAAAWQPATQPSQAPMTRETILPAVFGGIALVVVVLVSTSNLDIGVVSLVLAVAAIVSAMARSVLTSVGLAKQTVRAHTAATSLREAHRLARFGHWEWDLATDEMTASDELYRILELGDPKKPVAFLDMMGRVHPGDREMVQRTLRHAVQRGGKFSLETRVILSSARDDVIMSVKGNVDRSGSPIRAYGSAQDVTERSNAGSALHDAETLFRRAFDDAPVGMSLLAPDGKWLRVNDAYREMFGVTAAELAGMSFRDLTHPADVAVDTAFMDGALAGGMNHTAFESRRLHRDGRVLDVRAHSSLVRDEADAPMYFVSHLEDITEAKQGRRALDHLATLVDASEDAIFSTDGEGRVRSWNPASESLFAHSAEKAVGQPIEMLIGAQLALGAEETEWQDADGVKHNLSISASQLHDDAGQPAGCSYIVRDLSLRVAAETEQKRLEGKLHQAEKLDTLGTLAGGVAHDFNNLLAVIINYADFLMDDADDDQTRADLGVMRTAADRGSQLTRQLLMVTRRGLSRREVFGLDSHVRDVEMLLARTIGEDVKLDVSLGAAGANVELDTSELDQVLMNLAVNARQAMPQGGTLRIATAVVEGLAQIEFRDDGVGMTAEVATRALEPFFTTKEAGSGIGLATVQGVTTRAGGRTEIDSAPGSGTCVRVLLPIAERAAKPGVGDAIPDTGGNEHTGVSVLVVEDDSPVREAARRILAGAGYAVTCAKNGEEALAIIRSEQPKLVLTDVVMPGMAGTELAKRVRKAAPDSKVVFMTGYSEDTMLRNGLARGDLKLIHKPFDARTLEAAVSAALRE